MKEKKQMGKFGFIFSSLGAAIGLGVIWGLPGNINQYGGIYFFFAYIATLLIVGVPLLIFEFNLGNLRRKSVIDIFDKENMKVSRFIGWFQSSLMFIIPLYYAVLVGYTLISLCMQFVPNLISENNQTVFENNILKSNGIGVTAHAGFQYLAYLAFFFVIALSAVILWFGSKGIEKINKIFMPLLFAIVFILAIYIITIKESHNGIATLFLSNNLKKLASMSAWSKAFELAFFTTSIGMGMMIQFASFAPKNQDNTNKAYLLVVGILFISLTNLIFIFGSSGVIVASSTDETVESYQAKISEKFGDDTMIFVFNVLPKAFDIINQKTAIGFGNFLGILFFLALFVAGLSTTIGNMSVVIDSISHQYKLSNKKVINYVCLAMIIIGLVLTFEKTDNLIQSFQSIVAGLDLILISLAHIIFFMHIHKKIDVIIKYNNKTSWIKINKLYTFIMKWIIPLILITIIGFSIYGFIKYCMIQPWYVSVLAAVLGIVVPLLIAYFNTFYKRKVKSVNAKQLNDKLVV